MLDSRVAQTGIGENRARSARTGLIGQPIIITQNGKATAVLQDVESYQRQRQALLLLKYLARGDRDLREGRVLSDAPADEHFRSKLAALKAGG